MERKDLIPLLQKVWDAFFAAPPVDDVWQYTVRTTSGTSGKPLLLLNKVGGGGRSRFGDAHCVLMCMGSLNVRLSHVRHVRREALKHPMRVLPLSGADLHTSLVPLVADFAPDYLYGISGFVGRAAPYIDEKAASNVGGIWLCGESLTATLKGRLSAQFPNAPVRMEYIVTEIGGAIGIPCAELPPNTYHPARGVTLEIDAPIGESGELLITKRVNELVAVERYRPGDTARFIPTVCACGESLTFELLGRSGYDYVKVAGALARREEFDRVASRFPQFIDDYRAEVGEKLVDGQMKGTIVLRVFRKSGPVTTELSEEIARDFSRAVFLTPTQTYSKLVAKGLFLPLIVEFSTAPFPQKHKDVKLVSIAT